jgi:retron-type reverse transcriptase
LYRAFPKPGTDVKRPLGIPTIFDRCLQALFVLVLEPEWEGSRLSLNLIRMVSDLEEVVEMLLQQYNHIFRKEPST